MRFTAIDVETANSDYGSICQVGLATFDEGHLIETWETLVNPGTHFDAFNTSIHGIDQATVRGAPTFDKAHAEIVRRCGADLIVSHGSFDRASMRSACARYSLPSIDADWIDTARVARRAWRDVSRSGFALNSLCRRFEIDLAQHHNALADAVAAGHILLRACSDSGREVRDWLSLIATPIAQAFGDAPATSRRDGREDGPLFGTTIVFTGSLTIDRKTAADLAAAAGCRVMTTVGNSTTFVVVGSQDLAVLAGHSKSSKHRKAEELIASGLPIEIITEERFSDLIRL